MASRRVSARYSLASFTLGCAQRIPSPIRIVIGDVPRLLREIIEEAVTGEPDMMLVEGEGGDLDALVRKSNADVAIVADDSPDRGASHRQLLVEHPELKLLMVTNDGRSAQLIEFRRRMMSDVSPQAIVQAIRDAAGAG